MCKKCDQRDAQIDALSVKLMDLIQKETKQAGDIIDGRVVMGAIAQIVVAYGQTPEVLYFFQDEVNAGFKMLQDMQQVVPPPAGGGH